MNEVVLFDELATASGHRFGHATLNVPATLNALSLAMVDRLARQFEHWANDAGVVGVVLDAAGDKAFCAGGDLLALHQSIRETPAGDVPRGAADFFEREYRLDHRIHRFPKPVVCWGHGIVLGGGIGLMSGASHRVVTPRTRMAMPEISIGLYPDVGGSWFLRRMPGRIGLFLALTGAPLNAADARFAGMADFVLRHEDHARVLADLGSEAWTGQADADRARLSHLLQRHAVAEGELPASLLRSHFDLIDTVIGHDALADIDVRLREVVEHPDPWVGNAGAAYANGSPTSAAISYALWQRSATLSLAEVFRLEYAVSLGCCMHPDLPEGIRALLIDKDRNPQWRPASLAEIGAAHLEAHFVPRHAGPHHPLADLA